MTRLLILSLTIFALMYSVGLTHPHVAFSHYAISSYATSVII